VAEWKTTLRLLLIAAAVAAAVGLVLALGFVKSGIYDAGAAKRHTKFTEWLTHETMIHSVKRHAARIQPPAWTSAGQVVAGLCAYEAHCVACHGAAGVSREQWVNGMEPEPPYLLDATQRFSAPQLFWIAKNGIKMTGMPAWRESMSDREIWNVVAWLEASRNLPPQTYARWRAQRRCAATSSPSPGSGPTPRP
jgi:mono/diheme cytochrome c family protein